LKKKVESKNKKMAHKADRNIAERSSRKRRLSDDEEIHQRLVQMFISDGVQSMEEVESKGGVPPGREYPPERKSRSDGDVPPEQESKHCEIKRVVGHRVTDRMGRPVQAGSPGNGWQFQILFKGSDRTTEWVDDCDCDCEKSINEYLARIGAGRTIYCLCRVSSKKQTGPRHVSLEAQEQRIRQTIHQLYGEAAGRVKTVKLSASAYRGIPTALSRIGEAARPGDVIFIYRIDRLSRNIFKYLAFLEELNTRGVLIYAVDEGIWYHNRRLNFMQGILDANKEAEIIGRRVKSSLEYLRSIGRESSGSTSYGWRMIRDRENRLVRVKNLEESRVIKRIKEARLHPTDIAEELNEEGIMKRGKRWNASMVRYVKKQDA
jgi:DNA invertase Pin-like site-specific DNA recombinase